MRRWKQRACRSIFRLNSARPGRVYLYVFTWVSPWEGGIYGAYHGIDMAFVFGTIDATGSGDFHGEGPEAHAVIAPHLRKRARRRRFVRQPRRAVPIGLSDTEINSSHGPPIGNGLSDTRFDSGYGPPLQTG